MTSDQQFLLGLAAHLVTVLVALIAAVSSTRNAGKLDEVHKTVNGGAQKALVEATAKAYERGKADGMRLGTSAFVGKDE